MGHAKTNMLKLDPDMHTEPLFSFSEDLATKPKWKPLRRFVPFLPYQKYYWFLFGPPAVTTFLFLWEITVFMAKRGRPADILAVYLFFLRFDLFFGRLLSLWQSGDVLLIFLRCICFSYALILCLRRWVFLLFKRSVSIFSCV